jgi:hypothetical protein
VCILTAEAGLGKSAFLLTNRQNDFMTVKENADLVGAINILRAGHAHCACEVSGAAMPPAAGTHRSDSFRLDAGVGAVGIPRL